MTGSVLVTDSLFIGPRDVERLEGAGYSVDRLDKPKATEDELVSAIRGKVGYILGGIERVTEPVIAAADHLRVIAFTGSGYSEFVTAHRAATAAGIAITAATGGNSKAVSEYTLALILNMAKRVPLLTTPGGASFLIGKDFQDLTVGIVGLGHVGKRVAELCASLGFRVLGTSRTPKAEIRSVEIVGLEDLVKRSDIVSLHVDKQGGEKVLSSRLIGQLKTGASVVNAAFPHAVDEDALFRRVRSKELSAAFDAAPDHIPSDLPPGYFVASNAQTAFNTDRSNAAISEMVVGSLLNVLSRVDDPFIVNPGFKTRARR